MTIREKFGDAFFCCHSEGALATRNPLVGSDSDEMIILIRMWYLEIQGVKK